MLRLSMETFARCCQHSNAQTGGGCNLQNRTAERHYSRARSEHIIDQKNVLAIQCRRAFDFEDALDIAPAFSLVA